MLYNFYSRNNGNGIWETVNYTKIEKIIALSKTLPIIIKSGLANSTNKYFSGWKK